MDLEYFMKEAIKEAKIAYEKDEVPVGAVVVVDGKIIGRGHNLVENSKHAFKHAEIVAIKNAEDNIGDWRLDNAYLFTTIEPCVMCSGAILHSRIKTLVYGASDTQRGFAGSVLNIMDDDIFYHKVEVISGILEHECRNLMVNFFREKRRKKNE